MGVVSSNGADEMNVSARRALFVYSFFQKWIFFVFIGYVVIYMNVSYAVRPVGPDSFCKIVALETDENNKVLSAEIIDKSETQSYKAKNPHYSFLIPKEYESEVRKRIQDIDSFYNFNVSRISPEHQRIELTYDDTDDFAQTYIYESFDKEVLPKYIQTKNFYIVFFRGIFPPFLILLFFRWAILSVLEATALKGVALKKVRMMSESWKKVRNVILYLLLVPPVLMLLFTFFRLLFEFITGKL